MIEKNLLRNASSCSPDSTVSINPLKRVNFVLRSKWDGKTTIGNFLQTPSQACYSICSVEPAKTGREVLVYNHTFMEKNFHAVVSQPGIFTLNEGNIEAEVAPAAEAEIANLTVAHDTAMEKGVNRKKAQEQARRALLDSIWKPKRDFDNTALSYCFKSLNTRERLLLSPARPVRSNFLTLPRDC